MGSGAGPIKEAWSSWLPASYPGPNQQVWNSWFPKGKVKGKLGKGGKGGKAKESLKAEDVNKLRGINSRFSEPWSGVASVAFMPLRES